MFTLRKSMKLNNIIYLGLFSAAFTFASCSDFLDKEPDMRTTINSPESVRKLLVESYFTGNYSLLGELSSDNMVDNNSPHVPYSSKDDKPIYYNLGTMSKMTEEIFGFEPVKSSQSQDSPSAVWSGCYAAIAGANHALEAIDKLIAEGTDPRELSASKGEALLIRAYNHFILANVFCQAYKNPELSKADIGVPYVEKPETVLIGTYERGTVADVYAKIKRDLEEGLPLIDDANYTVAKYHFNEKAAHAFAARFYLYTRDYDKVIEHANIVLDGEDPATAATLMRDWTKFDGAATGEAYANVWIDYDSPSNIMFVSTYSIAWRAYAGGYRFEVNHEAASGTLFGFGPSWTLAPHPAYFASGLFISGKQDYGLYSSSIVEKFEYTDKVAGIGYPHIVRREFTSEETLLCRAEAYIYKGEIDKAVADLKVWDEARKKLPTDQSKYFVELTREGIESFYSADNDDSQYNRLDYSHVMDMGGTIPVAGTSIEPYINCVLHFRRLETLHDGNRFFDLKRYGVEYEHWIGKAEKDLVPAQIIKLTWNDPRRAIQLPQEVIAAGLAGNPTKVEAVSAAPELRSLSRSAAMVKK